MRSATSRRYFLRLTSRTRSIWLVEPCVFARVPTIDRYYCPFLSEPCDNAPRYPERVRPVGGTSGGGHGGNDGRRVGGPEW